MLDQREISRVGVSLTEICFEFCEFRLVGLYGEIAKEACALYLGVKGQAVSERLGNVREKNVVNLLALEIADSVAYLVVAKPYEVGIDFAASSR